MKTFAVWGVAALLGAAIGVHGTARAGENATGGQASIRGVLAGSAVPSAELGTQHARGIKNISIDTNYTADTGSALSAGSLKNNAVIGTSDTGMITTTGSINNNTGITTVFQNTGNNSLFQQTTSINISLH